MNEGEGEGATRALARYVQRTAYGDLPAGVVAEARRSLLNWVGVTLGGSGHAAVETALAAVRPFSGPAQASLLGRAERLDALHAALLNGTASHVLDFDDTHLATVIHPTGPVAAALLALAEYRGAEAPVSGADFVLALVLGVEVECRIGEAVYPAHYDVGWHITGTAGVFGAAAACARLMGLDVQRLTWALGTAATQAAGLREMFGTMCKPLHVGRAAQNGLLAALLAARGFTSSERGIEAPRGFASVLATSRDLSRITAGLGERYEILRNTYKPFACGIVIHPTIDGCVQLREEHGIRPADVGRVDLKVAPLVLELTGKTEPATGLEGKFSVYHSAAVAIADGTAREAQYADARVRDPEIVALRRRVSAVADPSVHEAEAHVTITLRDGTVLTRHVRHAVGSLERPMSDADLDAKVHELGAAALPREQVATLIDLCRRVETLDDVAAIARAARRGAGRAPA